jgi:restriction endonuclease S subunit
MPKPLLNIYFCSRETCAAINVDFSKSFQYSRNMSKITKLGDIASIQSGYSFRVKIAHIEGGVLGVVQAKDISGLYVNERNIAKINQEYAETRIQQDGDILLTSRGSFRAGVGKFNKPTIASSSLFTIRLTSTDFLPEYVAIYLNSATAQYHFSQSAKGATIQSLLIDDLRNLPIPHIRFEDQRTIVNLQRNIEEQSILLRRKQAIIDRVLKTSITQTIEGATK